MRERKPLVLIALGHSARSRDLDDRCAHSRSPRQMLAEKCEYLVPAVERLLHPVHGPVVIEDAVAGAVVSVELVAFAVLLELGLVLVHLLWARGAILVAEDAEQRAGQRFGELDGGRRRLGVELFLCHDDTASPQIGACVGVPLVASVGKRVPSTGAGAEHADLAVLARLCAQPFHCALGVADDLGVRNAALGPHLGGHVIRVAWAVALIKVGADRNIAVMGELARELAIDLAPARQMMDEHHPREGPSSRWTRHVGRDRRAFVATDLYLLHGHATVGHSAVSSKTCEPLLPAIVTSPIEPSAVNLSPAKGAAPARAWRPTTARSAPRAAQPCSCRQGGMARASRPQALASGRSSPREIRVALLQEMRHALAEILRVAADLLLAVGNRSGLCQRLEHRLIHLLLD